MCFGVHQHLVPILLIISYEIELHLFGLSTLPFVSVTMAPPWALMYCQALPFIYNAIESGTKAVIRRDDTAPHGVETPLPGTPLLAGVREAGDPHPIVARSFSNFIN